MTGSIEGFGGDGAHQTHVHTDQGDHIVWVKRDLWFDRNDGTSWIVWAQHHAWDRDDPPAEDEPEAATLGSIVVTDRVVMAFIDQLGSCSPIRRPFASSRSSPRTRGAPTPPGSRTAR